MQKSNTLIWLSWLIAIIAAAAAAAGLFLQGGPGRFIFTNLHGHEVEIYGQGLYSYDSFFKAPVLRGADAILLFAGVPFLIISILLYQRGSLRGGFLLAGALTCFLYNASSLALGAAYNQLFLLYIAYFSLSFFALILALLSIDLDALPERISSGMPHRAVAIFVFVAGLSPLVWLIEPVIATIQGSIPASLGSYTTDITAVLDVGIITPASILAAVLVMRRRPFGYLLSACVLVLLCLIGLIVVGQTVAQLTAGVELTAGQFVAFVVPFVSLSLVAIWLVASLLRSIKEPAAA